MQEKSIDLLIRHEGFRSKPYRDTMGIITFGHGLTYIHEDESKQILLNRVNEIEEQLHDKIKHLSENRQDVLINMGYNLGYAGLMRFKRMWQAIIDDDFESASKYMLESRWARQVKGRSKELAEQMRIG